MCALSNMNLNSRVLPKNLYEVSTKSARYDLEQDGLAEHSLQTMYFCALINCWNKGRMLPTNDEPRILNQDDYLYTDQ